MSFVLIQKHILQMQLSFIKQKFFNIYRFVTIFFLEKRKFLSAFLSNFRQVMKFFVTPGLLKANLEPDLKKKSKIWFFKVVKVIFLLYYYLNLQLSGVLFLFKAPITQTLNVFKLLSFFLNKLKKNFFWGSITFFFKATNLNKYVFKKKRKGSLKRKIWRKLL